MTHYATYTVDGTTALQVSDTAVRIRGTVYDFNTHITAQLVVALIKKLNKKTA